MKKVISGIAIVALAIAGGAVTGGAAYAAPAATTLIMSGGNGVFDLGPIVINGTASAAGSVAYSVNGKVVSNEEAVEHYRKTGEHLGKFDSPKASTAYAESLHNSEAKRIQ
jgi:hypothetical protein